MCYLCFPKKKKSFRNIVTKQAHNYLGVTLITVFKNKNQICHILFVEFSIFSVIYVFHDKKKIKCVLNGFLVFQSKKQFSKTVTKQSLSHLGATLIRVFKYINQTCHGFLVEFNVFNVLRAFNNQKNKIKEPNVCVYIYIYIYIKMCFVLS